MISVIIPTYNSEKYISDCLDSILNQTYRDIEIVCVNDGSKDNSLAILNDYKNKDTRIKIVSKLNGGRSSARNYGIDNSSGEYLLFVDADDELEIEAIEKLYKEICKENVDAVVGSISVIYEVHDELKESDDVYYTINYKGLVNLTDNIIDNFHCSSCGVLFKRNIIEANYLRFPEGLIYEDAYWHWCYFTLSSKVSFIQDPVYRYYRHPNSIMSHTFEKVEGLAVQHLYIAEKICDFWKANKIFDKRTSTVLKLIESYFWLSVQYSQPFEKAKAAYECGRILRKFELTISNNEVLRKIKQGDLAFLYRETDSDTKNIHDKDFFRFLQFKNLIDQYLPHGSFRRKIAYKFARASYKILQRI